MKSSLVQRIGGVNGLVRGAIHQIFMESSVVLNIHGIKYKIPIPKTLVQRIMGLNGLVRESIQQIFME